MKNRIISLLFFTLMVGWTQAPRAVSAQNALCSDSVQFLAPMSTADLSDPVAYQQDMMNFANSVEAFWQANMSLISDIPFENPCVLEYDPANVPLTAECGLTTDLATGNAFYCIPEHAVMWDGPTFFHPIYSDWGDKANLFIIAHEYGHAAQFLSGEVPVKSTQRELQADCYAGAYIQYAEQQGMLEEGDYQEIVGIVAAFGQSRIGTNWLTRTHGTSIQREIAMARGYQDGIASCQTDLESLAENGIERPVETLPTGESIVTLPNGNEVTVIVPESGDSVDITGSDGNTVTIPIPQATVCPPRLPRCR